MYFCLRPSTRPNVTFGLAICLTMLSGLDRAGARPEAEAESPKQTEASSQPSERDAEAGFLDWTRQNAIPLDSLDCSNVDPAAFTFLDEALIGKRVVYLGETDHFVAERMEFRLLLIRELARHGFRRIGMEMGLSDGKRMDRYLETGDEDWLDKVALYGYRGDIRTDRDDEVPGWTDDSHPEFRQTVLDEAQWFLRQLRKVNACLPEGEPRLKWFGYDLSFRPGGGYADAAELLALHKDTPMAQQVMERMARVPGESRLEEATRLEGLVHLLDENRNELMAQMGEADTLELRRLLQRMADAFRFIDALQGPRDEDATAAHRRRERRMCHNLNEYLAEWPPDEKIILLGHALHLSKSSESLRTNDIGTMWKSVGTHLAEQLPDQVYAIWLLHDHGMHGQPRGFFPVRPFRSPSGSVERLLARVHPILILPLHSNDPRASWLDEEHLFSVSGGPAHAVLPDQTDCIFFIETAHEPGKRQSNGIPESRAEGAPQDHQPRRD